MRLKFKSLTLMAGALVMALTMAMPDLASARPNGPGGGGPRASAKANVGRPGGGSGGMNRNNLGGGGGGGGGMGNRPGGGAMASNNRNTNIRGGNNSRGRNNVVAGNTVVVAPNRGGGGRGGYYDNGRYYDHNNGGHWDNDDNDFLEFVGKTAAITAGVSVVAAVIGSTTNKKPDNCQQSVSNGQVYMNCNGTWYQPMQNGSQTQYTVIAPPN